jgi:hypothetical protein
MSLLKRSMLVASEDSFEGLEGERVRTIRDEK